MRGTPAQIGFINGVTGYILGCKKGIYTDKGMKSFFGQPYLKIINIRGTHAQICFRKGVSKVIRFFCFCDLHHNAKYFCFICDGFFGKHLNFICVCTSLMICDRCMGLTCQVQISYMCQWQNPEDK